ncbi:MAG: 50S ribosomal protein L17 [Chloroflexota bacterium]|jgi:large subunit ribosomal protein L17
MRHRVSGRTLGRRTAHREAMLQNIVAQLIKRERISTTEARAKEARLLAERMITKGKGGSLNDRRLAQATLTDKEAVSKLFDELAPRYAERTGGYTRILKLGPRKGDSAPMALLELV